MRVKVEGFELGKYYDIYFNDPNKDVSVLFTRKNSVIVEKLGLNGRVLTIVYSKKDFKKTIKSSEITDIINMPESECDDFNYYDDYACENGCCACCGCTCDWYDEEWE